MSNPGYDDIVALNDSGSGNNNNNNSGYDIGAVDGNGFSTPLLTFAAVMTFLIMIVGIFGNFLTVVALIKCPKVRNVAAAFIISLCLADLLFCALVLPFSALRFLEGTWTHGSVLCRLIPFIQYGNIGVSLLCIAMITINRYVMIAHHSAYGRIYKRHWIAAMIAFCWIFSYGMQLPTLLGAWGRFDYDPRLQTCSIMSDTHGHSSKTTLFITAFIIPCLIIIACYTKIFWVVHKSEQRMKQHANKQNSIPNNLRALPTATTATPAAPTTTGATASGVSVGVGCAGGGGAVNNDGSSSSSNSNSTSDALKQQQANSDVNSMPFPACGAKTPTQMRVKDQREVRAKRNEWRITKMVLAIFLSFVICYLPITIVKVADKNVEHPSWHIFSYIMLYLSACINPIIYVIMNKQYRKAYKTVIMCEPSRLRILPFGKSSCLRPGQGVGGNGAVGGRVGGTAGCGGTSSAAEMERYRVEQQQPQSDIGFTNIGRLSQWRSRQHCEQQQQQQQQQQSQLQLQQQQNIKPVSGTEAATATEHDCTRIDASNGNNKDFVNVNVDGKRPKCESDVDTDADAAATICDDCRCCCEQRPLNANEERYEKCARQRSHICKYHQQQSKQQQQQQQQQHLSREQPRTCSSPNATTTTATAAVTNKTPSHYASRGRYHIGRGGDNNTNNNHANELLRNYAIWRPNINNGNTGSTNNNNNNSSTDAIIITNAGIADADVDIDADDDNENDATVITINDNKQLHECRRNSEENPILWPKHKRDSS